MKNVVELKTKKMSLANIDGRLTPVEMENIMAGSSFGTSFLCTSYLIGIGALIVGTGGAAVLLLAGGGAIGCGAALGSGLNGHGWW